MLLPPALLLAALLNLPVSTKCQKHDITDDKDYPGFVVYIIESRSLDGEKLKYKDKVWMCGGAIIDKSYVLTSGACISDIQEGNNDLKEQLWVVPGRISDSRDVNDGTNIDKKLVKKTFVLQQDFAYAPAEKWVNLDLGIIQVTEEFKIDEKTNDLKLEKITVNYDPQYQKELTDAIVYGWGSEDKYREPSDTSNKNSEKMKYTAVKLMNKDDCIKQWPDVFKNIIQKYMICSNATGNLDHQGKEQSDSPLSQGNNTIEVEGQYFMKECASRRRHDGTMETCIPSARCVCPIHDDDETRRDGGKSTKRKSIVRNGQVYWRVERSANNTHVSFCQNDHGAPLTTWRGPTRVLIGIASAYLKGPGGSVCAGPFTYMSTSCNGAFIKCVISDMADKGTCQALNVANLRIRVTDHGL